MEWERTPMSQASECLDRLNREYLQVHQAKEELFWATYMAVSDDHAGFARAEQAYKDFISDPERLRQVRASLAGQEGRGDGDPVRHGLLGWQALFECNVIEDAQGREHQRLLVEQEAELFARRRELQLSHLGEGGEPEAATLGTLATNLAANPSEAARKSSHDAFLELERWVLGNGFLDIVRRRNQLARALGWADYFDYKVRKNERMSPAQLFAILDDFEARTAEANGRGLDGLRAAHGDAALAGHNLRYRIGGDITRQMDPYLPFAKSLERWIHSFRRLGIGFRGAVVQMDLFERPGKFQNGFCHSPLPCHFDGAGRWVPGRINFTSEGRPDQVGNGARALTTLFHEGGHAAHMANVLQNAPCFSQEFPPTSMAYAETQSMFCDSLLEDADWLKRYALDRQGEPVPDRLVRARIEALQPFRAFNERSILAVPYFEAALYAMDDDRRTPEAVLELARSCEQRILGVPCSPRPLLAIPHLLNQESAAAYHGYLLAHMAVYQTRAFFLERDGFLADNPAVGPDLARHYWAPGNSVSHDQTLRGLTGEGFNSRHLAEACSLPADAAWTRAEASMAAAARRGQPELGPGGLDATLRVVHGAELIADNSQSESALCAAFEGWIAERFPNA
jgi:hypothetical protein